MNTVDLGSLIRLKRKEKGMNQKDLASLLHVSPAAVNKWENGKNYPDLQNLQAISALLEIPITDLLGGCPPSPKPESGMNNVTPEPNAQSSSPQENLSPPKQSLPEIPVPQLEDTPEPSDTALPDTEDTECILIPDIPVIKPEKASDRPTPKRRRLRLKTAVFLTIFLAGIMAFCWTAGGVKRKTSLFTVCDSYYGDYKGENAYYVITEFESKPTSDDILNHEDIIREEYGHHFSDINMIVIIYTQDYISYIESGLNNSTDIVGIIYSEITN